MSIQHLVPPWLASLVPYQPGKPIEEVEREYGIPNSIKIASNENPLGPSPKAVAAIQAALGDLHRYPDGGGFALKKKLAAKLGVAPAEVFIGNGSNEVLELAARAFLRPGEEAVMSDQAFVVYASIVQATAGIPRAAPLRDFTHDLDAILAAVTPKTRLVFLANPNNPTGTIYRRAAFERFLKNIRKDVVVIADEAYAEYVVDPEWPDSLRYKAPGRLLVTCRTFSKIYGLAGLRIGYAVAPAEIVEVLDRIRQPFNVNSLAQIGALAALEDAEHVARSARHARAAIEQLQREIRGPGVRVYPSLANFVLIDCGRPSTPIYDQLLRRGVIVRPLAAWGLPDHLRVSIAREADMPRVIAALNETLAA